MTPFLMGLVGVWVVASGCGWVATKLRQPRAVGEIVAGILLGPSLFGSQLSDLIFPASSRFALGGLANIGLISFMYAVGLDFDRRLLKGRWIQVAALAVMAVLVPVASAWPTVAWLPAIGFPPPLGDPVAYRWFIAAALSVSAFPVAVLILQELKAIETDIGKITIGTSAMVTVLMFAVLAHASQTASGASTWNLGFNLLGLLLMLTVLLFAVHPAWQRLAELRPDRFLRATPGLVIISASMAVASGILTNQLGFTYFLGPFLFGVAVPHDATLRRELVEPLRNFTRWLLLPAFFTVSGLSTNLRVLTPTMLPGILLIALAGFASKLLGVTFTGRILGRPWRESAMLASILNCRGLLVLVMALEGERLHIVGPEVYAALVTLALLSTMAAAPLFKLLAGRQETA